MLGIRTFDENSSWARRSCVLICMAAASWGILNPGQLARAAGKNPADSDRVDVDAIKEKYWARGDQSELGVVQNRLYTKAEKVEVGAFGGIVNSDPFLSVQSLGVELGYHFNEVFSVHLLAWKDYTHASSALTLFQETVHATADTNPPRAFYGGETSWSLMYGKLSVLGQAIIYYDFHVLAGAGLTVTDSGNELTGIVGLGQQIFLSRLVSLQVDWRLTPYHEDVLEQVIVSKLGQVASSRVNWSNTVTVGVTLLLGGPGEEK